MTRARTYLLAALALFSASGANADGLDVSISYDQKAENKLVETYGVRERAVINDLVARALTRSLGAQVARVEVVIHDITANRPTFKELSDRPGLSMQSFGIGGADLSGRAFDANGQMIGQARYDWTGDFNWADTSWNWSDADRTIYGFAQKLKKSVPGQTR